jgi:hypothetical protein
MGTRNPIRIVDTSHNQAVRDVPKSMRYKAATTQVDPISSGEEFNLQVIGEDDDDIYDVSGSDLPDGPLTESTSSHPVTSNTALNPPRPVGTHAALDIFHFFTEIEFPNATKVNERVQKVCKLCMSV